MASNFTAIKGVPKAIGNRLLVTNMYFGEQKTQSGIIITSDDGKTRGIYPRWGKVYSKGPHNDDPYEVGDWVLIEHGRWTRSLIVDDGKCEFEFRMAEAESVLGYSKEKPDDVQLGSEYSNNDSVEVG